MAEWMSSIHDRTQTDVDFAIKQMQTGNALSELKGCFNVGDINRIENNSRYLADRLNVLQYSNTIQTNSWNMDDVPDVSAIARLINNVAALIKAYYKPSGAPSLPDTLVTYEQVNSIEKNLYMLKHLIDEEENEFRHCGTFNCGEDW